MAEERLNPELLTFREVQYGEADKRWHYKVDELWSECGGKFVGKSSAASGDVSSQLTDTRKMGGILTGVGTLSSAGMKFLLKEVLVSSPKAGVVEIRDNTTTLLAVRVLSATIGGGYNTRVSDIKGAVFSSDCRIITSTAMLVHVGGYRLALSV